MNNDNRSKWQIRAATLSIFVLGFIAGALALNAYHVYVSASPQTTKQKKYDQIFNQLDLNESQRGEVQKIVGETRQELQTLRQEQEPRVQEIRGRADERFRQILTPAQWTQFQQLRDAMRQADEQKHKNGKH
jgi:Spy/CpxP family protein refolding chaperone